MGFKEFPKLLMYLNGGKEEVCLDELGLIVT